METKTKTTGILEDFQYTEQVRDLVEQLSVLFSESRFNASLLVIEMNHKTGETIVNHPAYEKGKHGTGLLIQQLAVATGKSEQHLYLCIQFYVKHRQVSNALETLQPDEKKLTWRHIVATLSGGEEKTACPHIETYKVEFTCCRGCGTKLRKIHNNDNEDD